MSNQTNKLTDDHVNRMRVECAELCERICRLAGFIEDSPVYGTLSLRERGLMHLQLDGMRNYRDALLERLELIK